MELTNIINSFNIKGDIKNIKEVNTGIINTTYLVVTNTNKYILQKINTTIIKKIDEVMCNINLINNYLRKNNYRYETLTLIKTKNNKNLYFDTNKQPWRCYIYIENRQYILKNLNASIMIRYGEAIGHFHSSVAKINHNKILNTIPDFHNSNKYYIYLNQIITKASKLKTKKIKKSLAFIAQFEKMFQKIEQEIKNNKIPLRICHNDTKISNVLFNINDNKVKCLIDLDTIMLNSIIYDFGDAIRTSCCTQGEDSRNKIDFKLDFFKSFAKGYLYEIKHFISKEEKKLLAFSPILVTIEQAMRFFTDYLLKNNYYKVSYPEQNLYRGLNQIDLAKKMLLKEKEMKYYIDSMN